MKTLQFWLWMIPLALFLACDDGGDDDDSAGEPLDDSPIAPELGEMGEEALDCSGAYELPQEFTGDDGLGHHGWTLDDLKFTLEWGNSNAFTSEWISDDSSMNTGNSIREYPWQVPEASYCYTGELELSTPGLAAGEATLALVLEDQTAFNHPWSLYGELYKDVYTPPAYDFEGAVGPTAQAILGLLEASNELPGAPDADGWDDGLRDDLLAATADYPRDFDEALARAVLSLWEAAELKGQALEDADMDAIEEIFDRFFSQNYATDGTWSVSPSSSGVDDVIYENAESVDMPRLYAAAMAAGGGADEVRVALPAPFDSPGIDVETPFGRIVVATADAADEYSAEDLEDVALLVDLGGDDTYHGRYAASHQLWMGAAVLIDAAGNDLYTPETADIESPDTMASAAFDTDHGFTQGCGLFGVGILIDAAGDDNYRASVYSQGAGAFGYGVLLDTDGVDDYRLGNAGQGSGFFGIGTLIDAAGDDRYGLYTTGQGNGRPQGQGLLLDLDGHDTYIAYYNDLEPWLPGPGYNNYFGLSGLTWPYSDSDGNPHYMSNAQGIGWGFRGDWFSSGPSYMTNWAGGFGALVDFGEGNDEHYADCMSMGQGFVYGWGLLYDGGGDDIYRTFWWGPAASAHMGVGTLIEEDGNDDLHVAWASGGFGYDCSVGWHIDNGGDDTFGGQFHYGKAYTYGLTFMINDGGDDIYNDGGVLNDPPFGIVHTGQHGRRLVGAFMDLGGGNDTYHSAYEGVGTDAEWYHEPVGNDINPDYHKGIGIDR